MKSILTILASLLSTFIAPHSSFAAEPPQVALLRDGTIAAMDVAIWEAPTR